MSERIEKAILDLLPLSEDGTGHVADCGYSEDGPLCQCSTLPGRIRDVIAAHDAQIKAEALRRAADRIDLMRAYPDGGAEWRNAEAAAETWLRLEADRIESQETP